MAYRSLGKDARRKGDEPLVWTQRKSPDPFFKLQVTPHFLNHLKKYAKDRHLSVSALMRFALADLTNYEAPAEEDSED